MPCVVLPIRNNQILAPVRVFPTGTLLESAKAKTTESEIIYALVDTGATCSGISKHLANKLGLVPGETICTAGVHGTQQSNVYTADLLIDGFDRGWMGCAFVEIFTGEESDHLMILGMDILSQGTLHTTWDKEAVFCV